MKMFPLHSNRRSPRRLRDEATSGIQRGWQGCRLQNHQRSARSKHVWDNRLENYEWVLEADATQANIGSGGVSALALNRCALPNATG